jgi:phosphatidylglycerol:prolipoprotein diacylglycerol transferase
MGLYGLSRIAVEFVRLPDADIGYLWGFVTMGQVLSLPLLLLGGYWTYYLFSRPIPQAPTPPRKASKR